MKKVKASTLRVVSMLAVFVLVGVGLVTHLAPGTVSSLGIQSSSVICPLGALETLLASKIFVPRAAISVAVLLVLAALLGRVFCAWICPAPLVRQIAPSRFRHVETTEAPVGHRSKARFDSRLYVLGAALLSTAIFGFPVFCLICPIGLTFATLIGLWRLFGYNEPTLMLLVFPGILFLELVVFRKWCRKICPLGALISLASRLNVFFRPKIDTSRCLRTAHGIDCRACENACFEEIDLHDASASPPMSECTKCRDCSDACPVSAISFPLRREVTAVKDITVNGDTDTNDEEFPCQSVNVP